MMSTDELMDARLAEAGERWREANATPAEVDFASLGSPAASGEEIPLDYFEPQGTHRHRHRPWPWLVAAAATLLVAAGITFVVRPSADHHGTAAASTAAPYGSWRLTSFAIEQDASATAAPEAATGFAAYLELKAGANANGDGSLVVADIGCNTMTGTVDVFHNAHKDSGGLTFGDLATTAMSCDLGPAGQREAAALQEVFVPKQGDDPQQALWTYDGAHLVLQAAPGVRLTYVASPSPDRAGPALLGTSWTLANFAADGGRTIAAVRPADIAFGADGSVQGDDGCNHFGSTTQEPTPEITGSPAAGNGDASGAIMFGSIGATAVGCIGANLAPQLDLFNKIVFSSEAATWRIYGGAKLALVRDGVGTLVFVRE